MRCQPGSSHNASRVQAEIRGLVVPKITPNKHERSREDRQKQRWAPHIICAVASSLVLVPEGCGLRRLRSHNVRDWTATGVTKWSRLAHRAVNRAQRANLLSCGLLGGGVVGMDRPSVSEPCRRWQDGWAGNLAQPAFQNTIIAHRSDDDILPPFEVVQHGTATRMGGCGLDVTSSHCLASLNRQNLPALVRRAQAVPHGRTRGHTRTPVFVVAVTRVLRPVGGDGISSCGHEGGDKLRFGCRSRHDATPSPTASGMDIRLRDGAWQVDVLSLAGTRPGVGRPGKAGDPRCWWGGGGSPGVNATMSHLSSWQSTPR